MEHGEGAARPERCGRSTPRYWAIEGLAKATDGAPVTEVLSIVAALCAFTLGAYGAAATTSRWARVTESV